jgi:hypothetical protein
MPFRWSGGSEMLTVFFARSGRLGEAQQHGKEREETNAYEEYGDRIASPSLQGRRSVRTVRPTCNEPSKNIAKAK